MLTAAATGPLRHLCRVDSHCSIITSPGMYVQPPASCQEVPTTTLYCVDRDLFVPLRKFMTDVTAKAIRPFRNPQDTVQSMQVSAIPHTTLFPPRVPNRRLRRRGSRGAARALGCAGLEAVLELAGNGAEVPHAAGADGLPALGLLGPVVCFPHHTCQPSSVSLCPLHLDWSNSW